MKLLKNLISIRVRNCKLVGSLTNVCRNFCSTKVYIECPMVSTLKIFMPSYKRNFMMYPLTFSKKSEYSAEVKSNKERSRHEKHKQGPTVSVIDENDVESVMSLMDAEKLAKRKNLKLVPHESSKRDKVKYKLEKSLVSTQLKKAKEKDKKKIILREETQIHDVEIKINQMIKFIDKGLHVLCIIEPSGNKEISGKVMELLEQSKLKEYFISKVQTKRNIQLSYGPQLPGKEDSTKKEEDKENAQVSK